MKIYFGFKGDFIISKDLLIDEINNFIINIKNNTKTNLFNISDKFITGFHYDNQYLTFYYENNKLIFKITIFNIDRIINSFKELIIIFELLINNK